MKRIGYFCCLLAIGCGTPQDQLTDGALRHGAHHYKAARYQQADSSFALAPKDEHAVRNRGNALYKLKDWPSAIAQLRNAVTMDSSADEQAIVQFNLGRAHLAEAMHADTLLRQRNEELAGIRVEAADITTKVNQFVMRDSVQREIHRLDALIDSSLTQAVEGFKASLRRDPNDEDARHNLVLTRRLIKEHAGDDGESGEDDDKEKDQQLSAHAERLMHRADSLVDVFKFRDALDLLQLGLKQDPTLKKKKEYMDKLDTVNKAAQAK